MKNKFKWEREETTVNINQKAIPLSEWVRKIDCKAKVIFYSCEQILNYVNGGKLSLVEHCNVVDLMKNVKALSSNERLPSSFTGIRTLIDFDHN